MPNDDHTPYNLEALDQNIAATHKLLASAKMPPRTRSGGEAVNLAVAEVEVPEKRKPGRPKGTTGNKKTTPLLLQDPLLLDPPAYTPPPWKSYLAESWDNAMMNLRWTGDFLCAKFWQFMSWIWITYLEAPFAKIFGWFIYGVIITTGLLLLFLTLKWKWSSIKSGLISTPGATLEFEPLTTAVQIFKAPKDIQLRDLGIPWTATDPGKQSTLALTAISKGISSTALRLTSRLHIFSTPVFSSWIHSLSPSELGTALVQYRGALNKQVLDAQTLAQLLNTAFGDVEALLYYMSLSPSRDDSGFTGLYIPGLYILCLDQLAIELKLLHDAVAQLRQDDKETTERGNAFYKLLAKVEQGKSAELHQIKGQKGPFQRAFGEASVVEIEVSEEVKMLRSALTARRAEQKYLDEAEDLVGDLPGLEQKVLEMWKWSYDHSLREGSRDTREHADMLKRKYELGKNQAIDMAQGEMITGRERIE